MNDNIVIRKAKEDATKILEYTKLVRTEPIFLASHPEDKMTDLETEKKILRESDNNKFWLIAINTDNELVGLLPFDRNIKIKRRHRASFGITVKKNIRVKK